MLDIKDLQPEDELAIIEEGLKSRFWELFTIKYQNKVFTSIGVALGEKTQAREWQAGKASGMKEALRWPAERARDLKTKISQKKSE